MIEVRFRVPDDVAAYVARAAREQKQSESSVWRELVRMGYTAARIPDAGSGKSPQNYDQQLNVLLRTTVQTLTTVRRLTGHVNENLVRLAQEDALSILKVEGQKL